MQNNAFENQRVDLLLDAVAELNASNIAIHFEDGHINYGQLSHRINQLARYIDQSLQNIPFEVPVATGRGENERAACTDPYRSTRIEPPQRCNLKSEGYKPRNILIFMERSLDAIIGLLATMKSDNTYVPIDYALGEAQFEQIIEDCQPAILLTNQVLTTSFQKIAEKYHLIVIDIHAQQTVLQNMPSHPLIKKRMNPMAYILYTSGTTGKPKGVQISHASLINFLLSMQQIIHFTQQDILLSLTPLTFDISAAEIYIPLINGAALVFVDNYARYQPNRLQYYFSKFNVSLMQATPITWQMLIENGWQNETHIRIICGGEALSVNLAKKLKMVAKDIWNFYGPTETTIWSTYYKLEEIDSKKPVISIGKPIANTQVYVLNEALQRQSTGQAGELYIGGLGVGMGYLNRKELTAKCFLANPFSSNPQDRLYKTGDLVVKDEMGNLHYLGRLDTQIKIRGHRIEASAIEDVLLNYQGIKECVVLDKNPYHKQELVAYLILERDDINLDLLQNYLKTALPHSMLPTRFVIVEHFPVTANGKIDRKQIPYTKHYTILSHQRQDESLKNKYEEILMDLIQTILQTQPVDPESNFFDLGLHSLLLVNLCQALNHHLHQTISVVDLFEHPTIRSLALFIMKTQTIDEHYDEQPMPKSVPRTLDEPIAIIGMACKLPGAEHYHAFWDLILQKKETISFFNAAELDKAGIAKSLYQQAAYVAARGVLENIEAFDAAFFKYTPSEAKIMDPQHRIFLEQAWSALEDAGYAASRFAGKIGVYAGMNDSSYLHQVLRDPTINPDYDAQHVLLATSTHYLATKVAYALGLTGPAMTVNTACSTGLSAIIQACNSLLLHDSDLALAGAITLVTPQQSGYLYQEAGILSPDGHCNVFDATAQGTVLSNGCGIVVLRRLSDALQDNDRILGVIKGWALNNDGYNKVGFTAPSIEGQVACIKEALTRANIAPTTVEYVEAHGTGTRMGDPIEISALKKGYAYDLHQKSQYCAIGSVKANIGHTDSAAGAIGLIKAVLTLQHKTLPPQIHYQQENPHIAFKDSPYYVNLEQQPWRSTQQKRLAAVHSLGFGGTNAHIILQEAPDIASTKSPHANVFVFSAKSAFSLQAIAKALYEHVLLMAKNNLPFKQLADVSYTLQLGREAFDWRVAIPYRTYEHLIYALRSPKGWQPYAALPAAKKIQRIIFGFVGQGAQYAGMAADIYHEHPYFKQIVDECCLLLQPDLEIDLRLLLFPKTEKDCARLNTQLRQTEYTQLALFVIEYSLAQLLISFGIQPTAMIGHSIGEYVAATLAGVLSLQDALKLVTQRAQLMASTEPGQMLIVPLPVADIQPYLNQHIDLAVHNAPNLCVVAGHVEDIANFEAIITPLLPEGLSCKTLQTSHAFHSRLMLPICKQFAALCLQYPMASPKIPYISNVTGDWITDNDLQNKDYWTTHLCQTVLFSPGLETLHLESDDIFIEIGPGLVLSQLIRQQPLSQLPVVLPTIPPPNDRKQHGYEYFLQTIAQLWLHQCPIQWDHLYINEIRQRCALPTYCFERKTYWVEPLASSDVTSRKRTAAATHSSSLFYKPIWTREQKITALSSPAIMTTKKALIIFCDDLHLIHHFKSWASATRDLYFVTCGEYFQDLGQQFTINPTEKHDYVQCLTHIPGLYDEYEVVHTWFATNDESALSKGPYSLLYFIQAFNELYIDISLKMLVLTNQVYSVLGTENVLPSKATILGPCKVIPQESLTIYCKLIDLECPCAWTPSLLNALQHELNTIVQADFKQALAYRGHYRFRQTLIPCDTEMDGLTLQHLKPQGVYLITGGLGGIGFALAEFLAKQYQAHLILMTRQPFLPEALWQAYMSDVNHQTQPQYKQIKKLNALKQVAASVTIVTAAVDNLNQLTTAITAIKQTFPRINGVIHAAGIAGGGIATLKSIDTYAKVLRPKLEGTANLIACLHDEPLDFFAVMSSITAMTGFPGQIDYCSANCALDTYVYRPDLFQHAVHCVAMNWLAWREVGMAFDSSSLLIELNEYNSVQVEEACLGFEKMINTNLNQIIMSKEDLNHYTIPSLLALSESQVSNDKSIIDTLQRLWQQTLGIETLSIDDDFYALGGHSLLAVSLLSKIRDQFKIKMPSTTLLQVKTIRGLASLIESHQQEQALYSPLVLLRPGHAANPPLFIIHPVGGTAFCFMPLAKHLNVDRAIYAFQDPSIEAEHALFSSIEMMATAYLAQIKTIQATGPYYVCGASFGALVAMEMGYQLEQENETLPFIGLIDGWAKQGMVDFDPNYIRDIISFNHPEQRLDKQQLWETLVLQRLNMMAAYTYKTLHSPVVLFKASEILPEYIAINAPDNHWAAYIPHLRIQLVPGDHNTMLQEPNVSILATAMAGYI